ncbi:IS3 family transposase [Nitrosomonas sp.]|uniref:IS3 family transposase n=1 Tax=Nitrosomonas sp. TaxID=42353 RepID=UPI00351F6830
MLIQSIHVELKGIYGSPRMVRELRDRGFPDSEKRVERLMRENGIRTRHKRRYKVTTDSKHNLSIAPNLLDRNFNPVAPNQVWTSDITYLWTGEGWLYLAIVLDLYNREVVGWSLKPRMDCRHRHRCVNNGMVPQETCIRIDAPLRSG